MSNEVKTFALGVAACVLMAAIAVGLPWAVRQAEHPPSPETQPLQYIGDNPPVSD